MRCSTAYLLFIGAAGLILLGLLVVHPGIDEAAHDTALEEMRRLTRELELTDPCLFTEARYTRHLSQADLHSAFQDHPLALEHFPSGSLVLPPRHLFSDRMNKEKRQNF